MEKWIRWEPINGLSGKYYLDDFAWSEKGFIVELLSDKKKERIEILFDGYIDAFRYTNESFYFKLFGDLSDQYGDDFYSKWSFFKVADSEYLKWLSEKSCTWSDQMDFIHFCIIGGDEVIDIVANYEPKVRFIEYKPKVKIIYTREQFGKALKEKIKNQEDAELIGDWALNMYYEHMLDINDDFKDFLKDLGGMSAGPEFEQSYEELDKIADRLIAGENFKLY